MKHSLASLVKSQLRRVSGIPSDAYGYVSQRTDNLLPGVRLDHFEADLKNGGGHELNKKFLALHSSSALAINTFAPFKDNPGSLTLLGKHGFRPPLFEKQLPTGLRGTPPNLDVYLRNEHEVVAIESKFLEYFTPKVAHFSESYSRGSLTLAEDCWWRVLEDSKKAGSSHLDVAQLVKHYLGLITLINHSDREGWNPPKVTLVYLFWEPANGHDIEDCQSHRRDIEQLKSKVSGSKIKLRSLSYPDLWRSWESVPGIATHVKNLKARYSLTLKLPC